jgi:hypothetical protein
VKNSIQDDQKAPILYFAVHLHHIDEKAGHESTVLLFTRETHLTVLYSVANLRQPPVSCTEKRGSTAF